MHYLSRQVRRYNSTAVPDLAMRPHASHAKDELGCKGPSIVWRVLALSFKLSEIVQSTLDLSWVSSMWRKARQVKIKTAQHLGLAFHYDHVQASSARRVQPAWQFLLPYVSCCSLQGLVGQHALRSLPPCMGVDSRTSVKRRSLQGDSKSVCAQHVCRQEHLRLCMCWI